MRFKVGVELGDLQPQTVLALMVCNEVYQHHEQEMVVTSVNDGMHLRGSYHYQGRAFDLRTKNVEDPEIKRQIVNDITRRLAFVGFDVVFEDEGSNNEHLHLEYDPK